MPKFVCEVVVEAFQMTYANSKRLDLWPPWLHIAACKEMNVVGALQPSPLHMRTGEDNPRAELLELIMDYGPQHIHWGDWIVQNVDGTLRVCIDRVFKAKHRELDEGTDGNDTEVQKEAAGG